MDELLQIVEGLLQFGLELIAFPIDGCPTFRCATQRKRYPIEDAVKICVTKGGLDSHAAPLRRYTASQNDFTPPTTR